MSAPRLRFAPAPTGYLHLGSARTALFNWLYAQQTGGELILRIEDTNAELNQPGLFENIIESLDWLGITFTGEPIHQSQRTELYNEAIETWVDAGRAYHRDGAVWFEMPNEGVTAFDDVIRGHVSFDNASLKDFVVRRSDGSPTFAVANCVDDLDLGITHIIRGEDMLNITPQTIALRQALGQAQGQALGQALDKNELPIYAHLPLIVNEQRKKLSKRRDDVAVRDFRTMGILPQALVNYLALLGWGPPDDIEVRPISEIAELFKLENVSASAAMFDMTKLQAMNATYIREMTAEQFAAAAEPWVRQADWATDWATSSTTSLHERPLHERLVELAPLIQERTKQLNEVPDKLSFFFVDDPAQLPIDEASWAKVTANAQQSKAILTKALEDHQQADWSVSAEQFAETAHQQLRLLADGLDIKLRVAQLPVRVALTGNTVGPPLFESIYQLGQDATLGRLRTALARL